MIAKIDCIPCILDDVRGAVEMLTFDENIKRQVMRESLEFLAQNIDLRKEPSAYITAVHRILKRICKLETPFKQRRRKCNELGLELAERLDQTLKVLDDFDRFSLLARWSIAGNALDFRTVGTGYDFDMDELERSLYDLVNNLQVNQLPQIYDHIQPAKTILFVHDNVGEIALDKMLVRYMREKGKTVVSAVRGGAITSDATMDDAKQVRLDEVSSSVILAGPDTLGVSFEEMSDELRQEIPNADLIITKGQANYYVFSEHKAEIECPIVYLFRTKCHIVSNLFDANENINIAVVL